MQPLISICIPTYNRAECLVKTIESIIHQPEFKTGEVEIVISDNASADNTGEVCKQYMNYPNFYYHRNTENVKDKNFSIVLSKAHGKLRKLNNDTFLFHEGAMKKLCSLVTQYESKKPFIFLRNMNDEMKELDFHDFVMDVGYWITWIANFTIWQDECENIEHDLDGCELLLWQVRKAYEIAYKKNSTVVYYQVIGESIAPPKKNISYGLYQVFYCNYMKLLQPYVEKKVLSTQDIEYLEKELLFNFFQSWVISYELNNTDMQYSKEENLKQAIGNQYKDKPYWRKFIVQYNKSLLKAKAISMAKKVLRR